MLTERMLEKMCVLFNCTFAVSTRIAVLVGLHPDILYSMKLDVG